MELAGVRTSPSARTLHPLAVARGSSSAVEYFLAKEGVAGANPVSRSKSSIKMGGEQITMPEEKPIGKVVHYYDKISVAIVRLEKKLAVGDTIKFVKGKDAFEQVVDSMEMKHGKLTEAKPGDEVGIKVNQAAKEGTLVYTV